MKAIGALLALLTVVASPVSARTHHHYYHRHYHHRSLYSGAVYGGGYYTNHAGHSVHRPVFANSAPSGASAKCGDGSYSFSESHRGTCSHHGGVAQFYR